MIDNAATKEEINTAIPHCLWYITDSIGDRITGNDHLIFEKMLLLDVFLLMFSPDYLVTIITLTNNKFQAKGLEDIT